MLHNVKAKKDLKTLLDTQQNIERNAREPLVAKMKERGKLGSVRMKLEKVMKNYGIDRSKYFGADLIGTMHG